MNSIWGEVGLEVCAFVIAIINFLKMFIIVMIKHFLDFFLQGILAYCTQIISGLRFGNGSLPNLHIKISAV